MKLASGAAHLGYCTNIHPGESLAEVRAALERHATAVKARVCPDAPFGIGLRLSAQAARELQAEGAARALRDWLDAHGLYVFTLNGFPYGAFHGARIKARAYLPDWRTDARLAYSNALADVLAVLLPDGVSGSISTVPGAYRAALSRNEEVEHIGAQLVRHAEHLHALRQRSGKTLALALEPEPDCLLATTDDAVRFFEDTLLSARGSLEPMLRRHLGVCFDACHAAVEFEEPAAALARLRRAGIGVHKLQLSSGLCVPESTPEALAALATFAEDTYLHQTVQRRGTALTRFADLSEALAAYDTRHSQACEWRVHFHVPIFERGFGALGSTQGFLREVLALQAGSPCSPHLEVETYTWGVLPPALRTADVAESIARELAFVLHELSAPRP